MNTKMLLVAVAALVIGVGGGYVLAGEKSMPSAHLMPDGSSMHGQMSDMMSGLMGKTRDDFDMVRSEPAPTQHVF